VHARVSKRRPIRGRRPIQQGTGTGLGADRGRSADRGERQQQAGDGARCRAGQIKDFMKGSSSQMRPIEQRPIQAGLIPCQTAARRGEGWAGHVRVRRGDGGGQNGNRRWWPGRAGGGGHKQRIGGRGNPKTRSDTMLGIDLLYSIGAKGHIQVCKYAGNPLTGGENTIYKYASNSHQ
jgi:hypothetical protein